jgi:hypothetical protein
MLVKVGIFHPGATASAFRLCHLSIIDHVEDTRLATRLNMASLIIIGKW